MGTFSRREAGILRKFEEIARAFPSGVQAGGMVSTWRQRYHEATLR
jgi:hypothetical protein